MSSFDDPESSRRGLPPFVLPALTAVIALGAGTAVGAAASWMLKPAEIQEVKVPRDLTAEELHNACSPMMVDMASDLDEAGDKVTDLTAAVKEKEAKVAELEAEMKRRGAKGAELKRELEAVRAELEIVKTQLEQAIQEKEQIVVELKQTKKALDVQKEETTAAKEDAVSAKWREFVNASQLDVCEKGNRKKLGKCREAVDGALTTEVRSQFSHCLRSGQEVPSMGVAEKNEELPRFARYLNQDDRILKDWYILLCDPNLPEAEGFASDSILPPGSPSLVPDDGAEETLGRPEENGLGDLLEGDE